MLLKKRARASQVLFASRRAMTLGSASIRGIPVSSGIMSSSGHDVPVCCCYHIRIEMFDPRCPTIDHDSGGGGTDETTEIDQAAFPPRSGSLRQPPVDDEAAKPRQPHRLGRAVATQSWKTLDQPSNGDLAFHARQGGAKAGATADGQAPPYAQVSPYQSRRVGLIAPAASPRPRPEPPGPRLRSPRRPRRCRSARIRRSRPRGWTG